MKTTKLTKVFAAAINEISARYSLPELLSATVKELDDCLTATASVNPTGQMSGIVKELDVKFSVSTEADRAGLFRAVLKYSYNHTGGGSNGYDSSFRIVAERGDFDSDELEYVGMIGERAAYKFECGVAQAVRENYVKKNIAA